MAKRVQRYKGRPGYKGPAVPRPRPRSQAAGGTPGGAALGQIGSAGASWWTSLLSGAAGFNEQNLNSNPARPGDLWGHPQARRNRYEIYWALYEQNIYREIHYWASTLKDTFDLYPAIRSIYSPAYRIGEFWAEHLFGGILDPKAGDGVDVPSCLPIVTENADMRPVIARLWRESNWQVNKDVFTRFGSVMGDAVITICDEEEKQRVHMRVTNPRHLRDKDDDHRGNVKGYVIEEKRWDPREPYGSQYRQIVTYTEVAQRVGEAAVQYETFLDGFPFDWSDDGDPATVPTGDVWTEDYGFIPMVVVQHRNKGLHWGWSEFHPSFSKILELDEMVSKLNDQIRKLVDCPWLFAGVPTPGDLEIVIPDDEGPDPAGRGAAATRSRVPAVYTPDPAAHAQSLVAPLDIAAVAAHVTQMLRELERDHPELLAEVSDSARDISGKAIRVAREKTEARVASARASYDDAMVRAHKMAIHIAASKGYPGYEKFDAGSYERGDLDHAIGARPVFDVDTMDHLEEAQARAGVVQTLVTSGWPVECANEAAGFPEDVVADVTAGIKKQQEEADARAAKMAAQFADTPAHAVAGSSQLQASQAKSNHAGSTPADPVKPVAKPAGQ